MTGAASAHMERSNLSERNPATRGPEYEQALEWLCIATGNPNADFRDGQWEAIDGVLHNRRQLVVQRTGWGKSMIYFLASKFLREQGRGMTLLISPLLALMRNQVAAAERVGVRCYTINSTNPREWEGIKAEILSDSADLLIVSPERLANDAFREEILEPITDRIGLLVIDEAHCVSDWGHDFRPDYKKISRLLEHLPRTVPVLATTATATGRVIADIEAQLGGTVDISRGNLVRKTLSAKVFTCRTSVSRPRRRGLRGWRIRFVRVCPALALSMLSRSEMPKLSRDGFARTGFRRMRTQAIPSRQRISIRI